MMVIIYEAKMKLNFMNRQTLIKPNNKTNLKLLPTMNLSGSPVK